MVSRRMWWPTASIGGALDLSPPRARVPENRAAIASVWVQNVRARWSGQMASGTSRTLIVVDVKSVTLVASAIDSPTRAVQRDDGGNGT